MRMMKKVLGTVTVLALSVSLLAGCGSTAASPVSSAASTAAESTTSSVVSETQRRMKTKLPLHSC